MSLISELKRRKVFKVGGAYLVVAWVVIQVAATVAPQLGIPDWAPRLVTLLVLLGFPVAVVLSWVFDVTPEGIRAEASSSGNRAVYALGAALAAAALGWYWMGRPRAPGDAVAARSIAVLPFVNMSGDPDQEYFSDGISEEILNVLARSPDLEVAARTSSFAFKGQAKEVPEIADDLNVRMVLEGSVRQQEQRVRITAQLIDARTGYHVWSQTYDRELTDIFAIQDEIAQAIGEELQARVSGGDRATAAESPARSVSPEAHDRYLRGLSLWQARGEKGLWDAIAAFEEATTTDADFARAWAGLGLTYAIIADYSTRISYEEAFRRGRDAAQRALALDPSLPEPFAALGEIAVYERQTATGLALLRRAIQISPSFATAHQWMGTTLAATGSLQEGLASLKRASELDPRSAVVANNYSTMLIAAGRSDEAASVCERVLEFAPDAELCLENAAFARLLGDGPEGARPALERWAQVVGHGTDREVDDLLAALEGRADRSAFARRLAAFPAQVSPDPATGNLFAIQETPAILVLLGAEDLALDYLERVAPQTYVDLEWVMVLPALDPIRCDPRFRAVADQRDFVDERAATVCAGKS